VFEGLTAAVGHNYINSLAYLRPSQDYPGGLVVSGGQDGIIEVRKPTSTATDDAERLLVGHANNVCALDISPKGTWIVSGGWDAQCRVWMVGKWETELLLKHGSDKSVLAVLALDEHTVITGSADEQIRVFDTRKSNAGEVEPRTTIATPEPVRALCKLPTGIKGHPSGAAFASASNDGVIRLWKLNGQQVGELIGHENYVYSLTALTTGEIVSAGEDRTLRVWSGSDCIQTITHPAISVWSVAVCPDSGDIVSGASDYIVRVFSRNPERAAAVDVLAHFNESVKASAIPQQQLNTQINKEKLDKPDWLKLHPGRKDGEVKMIREDDGSIGAHQWSMSMTSYPWAQQPRSIKQLTHFTGEQSWIAVGTVVDAAASQAKVMYEGKEYDKVFDVDVEEGKPPLKLPYNATENPYDAATKFLERNKLPISYLESVGKFIIENSKGITIGEESERPSAGTSGGTGESPKKKYLPHEEFITLSQAKFEPIQKKILSINTNLIKNGDKEYALNPSEQGILGQLITTLNSAATAKALDIPDEAISIVIKLTTKWAYPDRLPGLDLLRCMVIAPSVATLTVPHVGGIVQSVLSAALEPEPATLPINENSVMMALRAITNLFATPEGRVVAAREAATVVSAMERIAGVDSTTAAIGAGNRNVQIALTSAAFNYACLAFGEARKPEGTVNAEGPLLLCNILGKTLREQSDSEVLYRALMALGMLLSIGGEVRETANSLGAGEWVRGAVSRASDERVKDVGAECLGMLP